MAYGLKASSCHPLNDFTNVYDIKFKQVSWTFMFWKRSVKTDLAWP